jgi:hypothetical protein
MTRYTVLSSWQLLFLALFMSVFTAVLVSINTWVMDYRTLPMVYKDAAGTCTKVENFENGHAFNCHDVDVTLRRYRMPDEKISNLGLYFLQKGN